MPESLTVRADLDQPQTLVALLQSQARCLGDRVAIADESARSLSYRELDKCSANTAEFLQGMGISPGQRVAVVMPQGMEILLSFLALARFASFAPLNPEYTEAEFAFLLRETGAAALLCHCDLPSPAQLAAAALGIPVIVVRGWSPDALQISTDSAVHALVDKPVARENEAVLLTTSGTTARPKLVPLSHENLLAGAANLLLSLKLQENDLCLNMLAPFHIGALVDLLLAPLLAGSRILVSKDFAPDTVFSALEEHKPSWLQAVPTMLQAILQYAREHKIDAAENSLRLIRSVSAALPDKLKREAEEYFAVPVIEIYGMTETAGLICSNPLDKQKALSVGVPVSQQLMIRDAQGNTARAGVKGEVLVQGPNVFKGYAGLDEAAQAENFVGNWFRTGDEGYLDDEGFLFLSGRLKEIINRGGEKISPQEIDRLVNEYPGIKEAAAFSLPHESLGEEVALALVCGEKIDEQDLNNSLSDRLARHKVPRRIFYTDSLPKNKSGKVLRQQLSQDYSEIPARKKSAALPDSEPALTIARLWAQTLQIETVSLEDDFFDLGGDSLTALGFLNELKNQLGYDIHVTSLFEYPTLEAFASHLQEQADKQSGKAPVPQIPGLPPGINNTLQAYLSAWQGERRFPGSMIVGLNTLGSRPPLYWCVQGYEELRLLSRELGSDQPLYGMRSLSQIPGKNQGHTQAVAEYYAQELLRHLPEGRFYLGGFCEGASFIFAVAKQLQQAGREVALLCLHDRFIAEPYQGRVALFFCQGSDDNPFVQYHQPQRGWHHFYQGQVSMVECAMQHSYHDAAFPDFAKLLKQELAAALEQKDSEYSLPLPRLASEALPEDAYQAKLELIGRIPALVSPGEKFSTRLKIVNQSNSTWQASRQSGIVLANRWFNRQGKVRSRIDGRMELSKALAPGQSTELQLVMQAPLKRGRRQLLIDLADEGVCWFHHKGSDCLRLSVTIMPGGHFLNRVLNLFSKQ